MARERERERERGRGPRTSADWRENELAAHTRADARVCLRSEVNEYGVHAGTRAHLAVRIKAPAQSPASTSASAEVRPPVITTADMQRRARRRTSDIYEHA